MKPKINLIIYILIRDSASGTNWHVLSTFAAVNTKPTCSLSSYLVPGGISKEWRHIVSANCDFDREPLPMSL